MLAKYCIFCKLQLAEIEGEVQEKQKKCEVDLKVRESDKENKNNKKVNSA